MGVGYAVEASEDGLGLEFVQKGLFLDLGGELCERVVNVNQEMQASICSHHEIRICLLTLPANAIELSGDLRREADLFNPRTCSDFLQFIESAFK